MSLETRLSESLDELAATDPDLRTSGEADSGADPAVRFDRAAFIRHVLDRAADVDMRTLKLADMVLAFAAARGQEPAVSRVDALVRQVASALRPKFSNLPDTWDDAIARFTTLLLVANGDRPPKLLEYAGTGELRAFLRVSLSRFLLNMVEREGREEPEDLPFFEALSDGASGAEAAYLKQACRAELRASLEAAARSLEPRDRVLLRYAYADGKSVAEIGAVYGVHGATASRWVQKARERLASLVHADLAERLKLSDSEVASVLRAAMSEVELTLSRLLATGT